MPCFACSTCRPALTGRKLAQYLVLGIADDDEQSLYQGVRELGPGRCAWLDLATGRLREWQFWSLPQEADLALSDEAALDRFSELLEDAVRLRMRSDVPWAITLSGGTDSSAITAAVVRVGAKEVTTFTSCFPEFSEIDETVYAREVAERCKFRSVLVKPDVNHVVDGEPKLTWHQAAPYGTLSVYVNWTIISEIKKHRIPVILSGQGGDELFLGYERYYVMHCLSQFPNLPPWPGRRFRRVTIHGSICPRCWLPLPISAVAGCANGTACAAPDPSTIPRWWARSMNCRRAMSAGGGGNFRRRTSEGNNSATCCGSTTAPFPPTAWRTACRFSTIGWWNLPIGCRGSSRSVTVGPST